MFKFLFLSLAFSTSAMADLACSNAFNEELSIKFLEPKTIEGKSITPVQVIYTENGNSHEFQGDYALDTFELSSNEFSSVTLAFAKSTDHGGRCGRCSPEPLKTNVKLTLDQTIKYFTCPILF